MKIIFDQVHVNYKYISENIKNNFEKTSYYEYKKKEVIFCCAQANTFDTYFCIDEDLDTSHIDVCLREHYCDDWAVGETIKFCPFCGAEISIIINDLGAIYRKDVDVMEYLWTKKRKDMTKEEWENELD